MAMTYLRSDKISCKRVPSIKIISFRKDNAQSLFDLKEIPCDNQIRNLLDPIPAKTIFPTFKTVYKWLEKRSSNKSV